MTTLPSRGTLFQAGDGTAAPNEVFTTRAQVRSISGPSLKNTALDVSEHDGPLPYMEFIPGLNDPGEVSIEVINTMVLTFSDDHVLRIKEVSERLMADPMRTSARARINRRSLINAQSSFQIAGSSNPVAGLLDLFVMVGLQEEAMRCTACDARSLTF